MSMTKPSLKQKRNKWFGSGQDYFWHPFEYVELDPVLLDWHPALSYDPRDDINQGVDNKKALGLIAKVLNTWPIPYRKTMRDWIELDNISKAARLNGVSRTVFTNKLNKLVRTVREEMKL